MKIDSIDSQDIEVQVSEELLGHLAEAKIELDLEQLREETSSRQKSRLKWIRNGDCNTAFFHKVISGG